jgi:voltage-gated potassium channel
MILLQRFRTIAAALLSTVAVGTIGYHVIEGFGWLDALYMTVITLTTVGFGEVQPLSQAGRAFTVGLIAVGVGGVAVTFGAIGDYIVSGELRGDLERRRMQHRIDALRGHFIICGFGRVGNEVARQFSRQGVPFVVIDDGAEPAKLCAECGHPVVQGDATKDEVLRAANIDHARGLVATLDSDAENTYVALSARFLRPDIFIVARADAADAEAKLLKAGANRVLSPYSIGGRHMAGMALRPSVVDFLDDLMSAEDLDFWVEELSVGAHSTLDGATLGTIHVRKMTGANVLAIRKGKQVITNPSGDTVLEAGDLLIAFGSREQLAKLSVLATAPQ